MAPSGSGGGPAAPRVVFINPFGALVSRGIYIHAMFFFKSVPLLWGFSHEPLASGPGARRVGGEAGRT